MLFVVMIVGLYLCLYVRLSEILHTDRIFVKIFIRDVSVDKKEMSKFWIWKSSPLDPDTGIFQHHRRS